LEEIFDLWSTHLENEEFHDKNSEVEFKNSMKEIYFKIQPVLNEER